MKEIKSRAWDKREERMLTVCRLGLGGFSHDFWSPDPVVCDSRIADEERYIFIFFTGLHDRNGKEIWEGDIVSIKSNYQTDEPIDARARVYFGDGAFRLDFHSMILTHDLLNNIHSNWLIEAIGNIYENTSLLGEK